MTTFSHRVIAMLYFYRNYIWLRVFLWWWLLMALLWIEGQWILSPWMVRLKLERFRSSQLTMLEKSNDTRVNNDMTLLSPEALSQKLNQLKLKYQKNLYIQNIAQDPYLDYTKVNIQMIISGNPSQLQWFFTDLDAIKPLMITAVLIREMHHELHAYLWCSLLSEKPLGLNNLKIVSKNEDPWQQVDFSQLRLNGTLSFGQKNVALITVAGMTYPVQAGNYLGREHLEIKQILNNAVELISVRFIKNVLQEVLFKLTFPMTRESDFVS